MNSWVKTAAVLLLAALVAGGCPAGAAENPFAWPEIKTQARPHTYWWWMGSAVDTNNIARELARYHAAGLGGVHIIPIYGAKGWESNYIEYLSPKWMAMLSFTVSEARRLGMDVDMTTGTGWCFGGPHVTDEEANAIMVSRKFNVAAGGKLPASFDPTLIQALMAFGPDGQKVDLTGAMQADGSVNWRAPTGSWTVYAISQKPSGQKVKRAAPGGEGWMLNLDHPEAMTNYLRWFDAAFAHYEGPKPRAQYHDSYEYKMDWSPVFFAEFEKRRGYRLQDELDVFLTGRPADRAARVKCDYRETVSDIMAEETIPQWVEWSHAHGFITRNEAHGSPGNWLDLYADADIPETEMFYRDRNRLISKFASSAAHVAGKPLVSAETGTWLDEHFTETLGEMKFLLDDMFLSGVNHVFYHGTCYSPDEAGWPGWHFYASFEMNPRNSIWRDVPALNAYAARCQAVLQRGRPDNDILLYWPLHDFWSDPQGTVRNLTVHARDWFEEQPIGKTAQQLWGAGYQFDYISDRQLSGMPVSGHGTHQVLLLPPCNVMPLATLRRALELARGGATVLFQDRLPGDVSGLAQLEQRRAEFAQLVQSLRLPPAKSGENGKVQSVRFGRGKVLVGPLKPALTAAGVTRETLFDHPGLMCIRRRADSGTTYFVANRGDTPFDGWLPLARTAKSVVVLDPLTGQTGTTSVRRGKTSPIEARVQLRPGDALVLRESAARKLNGPVWKWWQADGRSEPLSGEWQVSFIDGGPELPAPFKTDQLASWTQLGDANAQRFAGPARYVIRFDAPTNAPAPGVYELDLGKVCQSARVRLNGVDLGTLFTPPFRVAAVRLAPTNNLLEVEVTNTDANRIRDLDRRGVQWKSYHDINFVNLDYRPFDASNWPLADAGLLGPVTLTPVTAVQP